MKNLIRTFTLYALSTSVMAEVAIPNSDINTMALGKVMGSLVIVLALFIIGSRLFKRIGPMGAGAGKNLSIVNGISLGAREKIMTVRYMDSLLLIGVTNQQITLLKELDADSLDESVSASGVESDRFSHALKKMMGR